MLAFSLTFMLAYLFIYSISVPFFVKSMENQSNIFDSSNLCSLILFLFPLFINSSIKLSKAVSILSSEKAKFPNLGQDIDAQLIPT